MCERADRQNEKPEEEEKKKKRTLKKRQRRKAAKARVCLQKKMENNAKHTTLKASEVY